VLVAFTFDSIGTHTGTFVTYYRVSAVQSCNRTSMAATGTFIAEPIKQAAAEAQVAAVDRASHDAETIEAIRAAGTSRQAALRRS
jgi:hypothetical protein